MRNHISFFLLNEMAQVKTKYAPLFNPHKPNIQSNPVCTCNKNGLSHPKCQQCNSSTFYPYHNGDKASVTAKKSQRIEGLYPVNELERVKNRHHFIGPKRETWTKPDLYAYFNAYRDNRVIVLNTFQRKCRKIVQNKITEIMKSFKHGSDYFGDGVDFYRKSAIEPAGRTATQTKVLNADEYDYNVVIDAPDVMVDDTPIYFDVKGKEHGTSHLNEHWEVCVNQATSSSGIKVPAGYTTVRYKVDSIRKNNQWAYFGFTGAYWDVEKSYWYTGYIIPRWVQEDLYTKVQDALSGNENVSFRCVPHGPAITVRLKGNECIKHEISVDFAVAIKVEKQQIAVSKFGWPRLKTKQCLSQDQITRTLDAGVCLVPKNNLFWYISFSKAAKILLRSIDSTETCRLQCHKILKTDFLHWKSEKNARESFKGISTFIFKNHLFWFNENNPHDSYWHVTNIGQCYIDMLKDLANKLTRRSLPNYFNEKDNLLATKDDDVLDHLADRIKKRVNELDRITECSMYKMF